MHYFEMCGCGASFAGFWPADYVEMCSCVKEHGYPGRK